MDEFNVSSTQFVGNLQENPAAQEKALEQILEYELLLIQQLNFHLVIHNPYRPLEGFLIDLKVSHVGLFPRRMGMFVGLFQSLLCRHLLMCVCVCPLSHCLLREKGQGKIIAMT